MDQLRARHPLIRWGSGPVCFELRSPDSDIIEMAQQVLGKWRARSDATLQGEWEVRRSGDEIFIDPMPEYPDEAPLPAFRDASHAITCVEYAAVWRIVEHCNHLLSFHAALLSKGGRGVAIVGASTAGKSTLATALWTSGWDFLCDDLTIALGSRAVAGPRRVSLREGSRGLVGENLWSDIEKTPAYRKTAVGCLFHPMQEAMESQPVDLSAVVFLRRSGAPEGADGPTQLNPARAAIALLPYTNLVRNLTFPAALAPVAELMSQVPGYDLPRAPLTEMVASVESLCGV